MSNRSFVLETCDGQTSRLRLLRNGVPQGLTLAPMLFNIYTYNVPATAVKMYGYTDDLAILHAGKEWGEDAGRGIVCHRRVPAKVALEAQHQKNTACAFYLNDKEAEYDLDVQTDSKAL